jgi:hypothetical protein
VSSLLGWPNVRSRESKKKGLCVRTGSLHHDPGFGIVKVSGVRYRMPSLECNLEGAIRRPQRPGIRVCHLDKVFSSASRKEVGTPATQAVKAAIQLFQDTKMSAMKHQDPEKNFVKVTSFIARVKERAEGKSEDMSSDIREG